MWEKGIVFNIGDRMIIEGRYYNIERLIEFHSTSGDKKWTQYGLIDDEQVEQVFIHIESINHKCTLFYQKRAVSLEEYTLANEDTACLSKIKGRVNKEIGECVKYKEYVTGTDEIIVIEEWKDEKVYFEGYDVELSDIIPTKQDIEEQVLEDRDKRLWGLGAVAMLFLVSLMIMLNPSYKTPLIDYIEKSSLFTYETTLKSDLEPKESAMIYKSSLTVEETVKKLIDECGSQMIKVKNQPLDQAVVILTDQEYCLIYISQGQDVLVQVSTRRYAYSSSIRPYRAYESTDQFYRSYYYRYGYRGDTSRYGLKDSYKDYIDAYDLANEGNRYNAYLNAHNSKK